ncbi:MAG: DUF3095 domain-containing protein [Rickettsiales bacterium]|nr:DUF3095 domain-containing protein [Rickettsiales bacterium]
MTTNFFTKIPAFTDFNEATALKHYHPAPSDWYVIVADVAGSTQAIEQGRYKDVNMLGAACIIAAVNACGNHDFPYVFGGDGATMLVPQENLEAVKSELLKLKYHAIGVFDLSLRVGVVPISEIEARKKQILVARYELPTHKSLAMFYGGGVALADDLVKHHGFVLEAPAEGPPDLTGLSCRWQPVTTSKDHMMSLLVMLNEEMSAKHNISYESINRDIDNIIHIDQSSPITPKNIHFKWPANNIIREAKLVWSQKSRVLAYIHLHAMTLMFHIMNQFDLTVGFFSMPKYRSDMITNSDYRKFDDMLRMVVDCSKEQADKVEKYLNELHARGLIAYGVHYSDTAILTCFFESAESNGHVHFIDGNDGGYAVAAKQLKQQIKRLSMAA